MGKIIRRVHAAITKLFEPRVIAANRPPNGDVHQTGQRVCEAAFFRNLRSILASNGGLANAGRINVIGLDRLKEKLGPRWEPVSDRVHALARSALRKCLQPQDVWTACGDKYVIAFATLDTDAARTKCRMIAQIIENALLGEADGQGVSVATAVATVDGQILLRDLPSLDAILATAPQTEPAIPPISDRAPSATNGPAAQKLASPPPARSEDGIGQATDDALLPPQASWLVDEDQTQAGWSTNEKRMIGAATEWSETLRQGSARSPSWVTLQRRSSDSDGGPSLQSHEGAEPTEHNIPGLRTDCLEMIELEEDIDDEIVWEPVWDVRNERVPIYRAKYIRNSRIWMQPPTDELLVRNDFAVRDKVLRELTGSLVQSRYVLLGLPVQFWTIANYARRRAYLTAVSQRVSPTSRKFLLVYITDVPDGVSASRMLELLASLRPFCREIVIETALQNTDFVALGSLRIFAVGTDLSGSIEAERIQMLQIDQFARGARKAGIANFCLAGIQSMPLMTAAIAAGFRYISGKSIAELGAGVSNVRPLSLDHVYRLNAEAKGLLWPGKERGAA